MTGGPPQPVAHIEPDRPVELAPGLVRLTAPNPGMMTGPGTNTYLVGTEELIVVDPGPAGSEHLDAVEAVADGRIGWIVVTHTHRDHSPGAEELARRTGAPRLGFASRDGFVADLAIGDGFELRVPGSVLRAVHTPGHASNHLCFAWERPVADGERPASEASGVTRPGADLHRVLFTGDHVMQGSTVVIAPPDGDMAAYLASLRRVRDRHPSFDAIAPGHGHLIDDPVAAVDGIIAHRLAHEAKVVDALRAGGPSTVDALVVATYDDVDADRHPIARRSLWAHLRKLARDGRVAGDDPDDDMAVWRWVGP